MSKSYKSKINILQSYYYLIKDGKPSQFALLRERARDINLFLDCGAYTVATTGAHVALDNYIEYIKEAVLPFKEYFTLDVLGNPVETDKNFNIMVEAGLHPIPIFTKHAPFKDIDRMYKSHPLIAIGALEGGQSRIEMGYIKRIMREIGSRKVHWLGYANRNMLYYYKPYSCDNSTITCGFRYGVVQFYLGKGRWLSLSRQELLKKAPNSYIRKLFNIYGRDYRDMLKKENWFEIKGSEPIAGEITIKSWVLYSIDIERSLGIKFFLAFAPTHFQRVFKAYDHWFEKGVINENGVHLFGRS